MSTVHEQFLRCRRHLIQEGKTPGRVIFSPAGFTRALKEADASGTHFGPIPGPWTTYMGLPYESHSDLADDIVVTEEPDACPRKTVSFRVDHLDPRQTTMEIAGQALTKAQLCDIMQAWADAHPDDKFTAPLRVCVRRWGRFE